MDFFTLSLSLSPPLPLPVTGEEYDAAVANLMAMGFEREQVVRALHASFNNPERAAEYLFSVSHQLDLHIQHGLMAASYQCNISF